MHLSKPLSSEPETRYLEVRMEGAGAAAPTKKLGQGVTITRTGVGDYLLTLTEATAKELGKYAGVTAPSLEGGTPANLKNVSVTLGAYNSATRTMQVLVWSSAGAARELAATEFLAFTLKFKASSL